MRARLDHARTFQMRARTVRLSGRAGRPSHEIVFEEHDVLPKLRIRVELMPAPKPMPHSPIALSGR
jgi:hypothetical protein